MKRNITIRLVKSLKPSDKPYEVLDTDITGFLLRVQPTGRMTYYLAYRLAGKKTRYKIGIHGTITATQARDTAKVLAGKVAQGIDIQAEKKATREARKREVVSTLRGFLDREYEPWAIQQRKTGAATVARIRHNFAELLDKPLADLSPWLVDKWRAKQTRKKKKTSTINRDIVALKSALSKAVEWGIVGSHPLAGLKLKEVDSSPNVRYLSDAEEKVLRKALLARDAKMRAERKSANQWRRERGYPELPVLDGEEFADYLRPLVLLAINTGLRRGELFHLTWANVNFHTRTLAVDASTAKSARTRHVPLNDEAFQTLKTWRAQTRGRRLVFPGREGEPLDNIRRSWAGVLEGAKIKRFRFHDLRHHFASKLVMAGVDLNTVRELLGHADIKMTLRYAHLAPEHKADAVARL